VPETAPRSGLVSGGFDVPDGWKAYTEVRLVEPDRIADEVPLSGRKPGKLPPAIISAHRKETRHQDPRVLLEKFLKELAKEVTGFNVLGDGEFAFDDGGIGVYATVAYDTGPATRVAQRHIYRIDQGHMTRITLSIEARREKELDGVLRRIAASFSVSL
jgi:hypothetical protein